MPPNHHLVRTSSSSSNSSPQLSTLNSPTFQPANLPTRQLGAHPHSLFTLVLMALYALLALEVFFLGAGRRTHGDSDSYLRLADSLAHGRGMVERMPDGWLVPNLIRPPGYPAFLAAVHALFGKSLEAPVVAQALLVCLALEIVRRQVERLRGRTSSLVVPGLAAVVPGFLVHAGQISSEAPALFLQTLGLALATAPVVGGAGGAIAA